MTPRQEFTAEDVRRLLHELGRRLSGRGIAAEIYVFGGSAMAMAYNARRTTRDIEAFVRALP